MTVTDAFQNRKALIAFLTCGDPDLETTAKLIREMEKGGADLIELGIPFSDPIAEGDIIQGANRRALANGATTDQIFDMVRKLRKTVAIPLVFMTYANVIFSYGTERFLKTASEIGMNGIILPDVPFEEKQEFSDVCKKQGLDFISLIAPTSKSRISMIAKEAEGFIYCVSSLGVTGMRSEITSDIDAMIEAVRSVKSLPVAVGFGISTPRQAAQMASKSDGVIIGSVIVKLIGQYGEKSLLPVYEFIKSIREALDS